MLARAIRESWPLFVGMLLLMLSNGLLVTLLTVRGTALGFSELGIGVMQAAYPVGAVLGCIVTPRIVVAVGHARAFGALAYLCSIAALVHLVTTDIVSWTMMRALAGFCFPGLYVVAESWLNARANNETRATLLGIYFVVQVGGSALGQTLLIIPDESGSMLFVLCSILVSLSLVPMLLIPTQALEFVAPERVTLKRLFRISPFGFIGSFLNGVAQGMVYIGLGLFGASIGVPAGTIGLLIAATALGSAVSQFPIGALSDRVDRRMVVLLVALLSLGPCLYLALTPSTDGISIAQYAAVALLGATLIPIYSLCVAHTNDRLRPEQIVPAAGALVLILNAGVILGPMIASWAITLFGPSGFFTAVGIVQLLVIGVALMRLGGHRTEAMAPGTATPVAATSTAIAAQLNPASEDFNDP